MYHFKISKEIDSALWNENLLKNKNSTFYQNADYLRPSKISFPIFIYVYNENNEIKGQLGLSIRTSAKAYSSDFFKKSLEFASKWGNRGSWVGAPTIHEENEIQRLNILKIILKALEEVAKVHNLVILDGYSPAQDNISKDYLEEFKKNDYKINNYVTFRTDLTQSIDEIWKKVAKSARNDVTRAKHRKVEIKQVQTQAELIEYSKIRKKWSKSKGIQISEAVDKVEEEWRYVEAGLQKYFVAYQDGEFISGLKVGCFNNVAYTNAVISAYEKEASLGGPALTWYAIEWAKKNGMRVYDFSGVILPASNGYTSKEFTEQWKGLTAYKRKWGGVEYPYYHFIKIRKKLAYKIFRGISKPDVIYRKYKKRHFKRPHK